MKLQKLAGATSEIWQIFIQDSTSTIGAGLTGLVFNTASLTAYYHRDTDTTATAITLVTMTVGTFTSSGFKEIDATNMPGWYQFCPPNAALASGAKSCGFHLKGAASMAPLPIEVQLTAVNPDSATAFLTSVATVTTVTNQLTAAQIATGIWQDATAGDFTTASSIGKSLYTSGVVPGGTNGLFIAGTNAATTITTALTTTFTGSLTGSVASVTAGVTLAAAAVQAIWDALTSALTTAGSVGKLLVDKLDATISSRTKPADTQARVTLVDTVTTYTGNTPQTGDAYTRLGAPAGVSTAADIAAAKADTAAIKTKTDSLTFTVAGQVDGNVIDWKSATAPAMTGDAFARLGVPAGASVSADAAATKALLPTALVGGRMDSSVGAIAAGVDLSATMKTSVTTAATSATPIAASVTGNVGGVSGVTFPATVAAEAQGIKRNTALAAFTFPVVSSVDHLTPQSGLTITATRSIDGAAFAACSAAVTEITGTGYYKIDLAASDLNGDIIAFKFASSAGGDLRTLTIRTVA